MNITGRDVDVIALQEFSQVMNDFNFDMSDETKQLSVTYGEQGKRWIKRIKKIDPFWNADLFISNLFIQSMQKAIEEKAIEEKAIEEKAIEEKAIEKKAIEEKAEEKTIE